MIMDKVGSRNLSEFMVGFQKLISSQLFQVFESFQEQISCIDFKIKSI